MDVERTSRILNSGWGRLLLGRRPKWTMLRVAALVCVSFLMFRYVLIPIRIEGSSMAPAYKHGRVNFVNRLSYVWREPRRGDVVAVKTSGTSIMYLKRIVALPGETFAISNGIVFIDGRPIDEPYVHAREPWVQPQVLVGPDELVVIGDNRGMDSWQHSHGRVKERKIAGKVLW